MGAQMRRHVVHIMRRADCVHIDRNDVEVRQGADEIDALTGRQTPQVGEATPGATEGSKMSISKQR